MWWLFGSVSLINTLLKWLVMLLTIFYHPKLFRNYYVGLSYSSHVIVLFRWMLGIAILMTFLSHILCIFLVLVDFWYFSLFKSLPAIIFKDHHDSILNWLLFLTLNNTFLFFSLNLYKLTVQFRHCVNLSIQSLDIVGWKKYMFSIISVKRQNWKNVEL